MTVVVANRKTMAVDSRLTGGGPAARTRKIYRFGDSLLGLAGHWDDCQRFLDYIQRGGSKEPKFSDHDTFCALELNPKGLYYWSTACLPYKITEPYYAIGSGALAAMGAMAMGADPKRAAQVACKFDEACGPPIRTASLR